MHLLATAVLSKATWHTLRHMGGPGLIVLGLVEIRRFPSRQYVDLLTIVLGRAQRTLVVLRPHGDHRLHPWGISDLSARNPGRQRNPGERSFPRNVPRRFMESSSGTDSGRSPSAQSVRLQFPSCPFGLLLEPCTIPDGISWACWFWDAESVIRCWPIWDRFMNVKSWLAWPLLPAAAVYFDRAGGGWLLAWRHCTSGGVTGTGGSVGAEAKRADLCAMLRDSWQPQRVAFH